VRILNADDIIFKFCDRSDRINQLLLLLLLLFFLIRFFYVIINTRCNTLHTSVDHLDPPRTLLDTGHIIAYTAVTYHTRVSFLQLRKQTKCTISR
jgi:hypothetical protein